MNNAKAAALAQVNVAALFFEKAKKVRTCVDFAHVPDSSCACVQSASDAQIVLRGLAVSHVECVKCGRASRPTLSLIRDVGALKQAWDDALRVYDNLSATEEQGEEHDRAH